MGDRERERNKEREREREIQRERERNKKREREKKIERERESRWDIEGGWQNNSFRLLNYVNKKYCLPILSNSIQWILDVF